MSNSETRVCQNCGRKFVIEPEDFEFYKKIGVPPPTLCPDCRLQRRLAFRNERNLYRRKCDFSGKNIISIYHPNSPYKVYDQKIWWSDKWDPMDYGRDYDFNRPFFEQFEELMREVPQISLIQVKCVNSDYCNYTEGNKDCYLVFGGDFNENVSYSTFSMYCQDSLDLYWTNKSELCYENTDCANCSRVSFSKDCDNCSFSSFLLDCRNCHNCFGCVNLRNKSYCIFNKQYTKEEYFEKLKIIDSSSFNNLVKLKEEFKTFTNRFPRRATRMIHSHSCTGDNIRESKNCQFCFDVFKGTEDAKYIFIASGGLKDCYDCDHIGLNSELSYESPTVYPGNRVLFSHAIFGCDNIYYSDNCYSSHHLFGCIGLRHKQYCILNKQYTKEEYEKLVPKIIEQMNKLPYKDKKGRVYKYGEFFPIELSPFAYNETVAQEYFPLTKEEAINQGYSWYDRPKSEYQPTIKAEDLPDHIKDVDDSITQEVIECANNSSGKCQGSGVYRILPQELEFYRKMNLPLPRLCPACRHQERIKQRNPMKLYKRRCMCGGETSTNGVYKNTAKHFHNQDRCPNEFYTTYPPESPEIVYCDECYRYLL